MGFRSLAVIAIAFLAQGAEAAPVADQRAPLKGVTAARIANYGAPSVLVKTREEVSAIVDELSTLRGKAWRRGDHKLSCYSTVMVLAGEKIITVFRVTPDYVVERPVDKALPAYTIAVGDSDLPVLAKLLAENAPPKRCR